MRVEDTVLTTKTSVNYLGMRLDPKLTFARQIEYATQKAAKITTQLSRLMANVGGPLQSKRKLLMEACNGILLYGSEVWAETLKTKCRAKMLLTVQRTSALRVTSAYRTVSAAAVLVIAGMKPIDLQALERMEVFSIKENNPQPLDFFSLSFRFIIESVHMTFTISIKILT
ncbi:Putative 115 kDa protein in type-1 retrotransposable element R1DM [Eumeta japonica]|uniref:115 kDa protein in type-1 retrotransposable element R1DM n=1 Tax=Eumeta variegata TaxID=151549 RepID=A0A4C1SH97_EUMVA|nr:Putative 115 kDa protein in type-1 retrotransposable element R1DM [Eumeta japonica]